MKFATVVKIAERHGFKRDGDKASWSRERRGLLVTFWHHSSLRGCDTVAIRTEGRANAFYATTVGEFVAVAIGDRWDHIRDGLHVFAWRMWSSRNGFGKVRTVAVANGSATDTVKLTAPADVAFVDAFIDGDVPDEIFADWAQDRV